MNFSNYYFVVIYVIGLCLAVNYIISVVSGWAELARVYRFSGKFEGRRWRFQSGQMRLMMNIHNALTVGANDHGLYLAMFFPFRPGMPSLLIPWADISAQPGKFLFWKYVEFRFRQAPAVYLQVGSALAEQIASLAGPNWPTHRSAAVAPF